MTTDEILALTAGAKLNNAVHELVFGGPRKGDRGRVPLYSSDMGAASKILDRLPLTVGRVSPNFPQQSAQRPYVAGVLQFNDEVGADVMTTRVTAATPELALCKAALVLISQPATASNKAVDAEASAQAARDLAARVGTPAARNPTLARQGRVPQPTTRIAPAGLAPMPERTQAFVAPQPLPAPGGTLPAQT